MIATADRDDIPDAPPDPGAHPLRDSEEGSRLRVALRDGRVLVGRYTTIARQHFLHCTGPGLSLLGEVEGPLAAADITAVEVVKTRAQIHEEGRELLHGPRVPGPEPMTRDDFEHRLQTLARAVMAVPEEDWEMQIRLKRQFEACAAVICLSPGKQAWILAAAKWARRSNAEPTMADLWVADVANPSCFARPRPQDFDPDPVNRWRRVLLPPEVRADPFSVPNMLAALIGRGLKARITRSGDPPHQLGHIQVVMPVKGRARFVLIREPRHGTTGWRAVWDGNDSKPGLRRRRLSEATEAYRRMRDALRTGRRSVQPDLFG